MTDSTDAKGRLNAILTKEGEITDEEITDLRKLVGPESWVGTALWDVAHFRMNVELIAAIRSFDNASANLITTTNRLTRRILLLTYVVIGLGFISVIPVVRDLISFLRTFAR